MASVMDTAQNGNKSQGNAQILAIGTATPPHFILQQDYPDFYFKVTNSEHMVDLKEKFKRICAKSAVRKRHFYLTEEILKKHQDIACHGPASLDSRQKICEKEVPIMGKEAALIAIREWGQPVSKITHVVFATVAGVMMPGVDFAITNLLGLKPNVKRVMIYYQGCFAGGTAIRVAKDIAENNKGARVLVVCCEHTAMLFHGPSSTHSDVIVGQAIFSDGAAAMIIGANPNVPEERPVFEIVSASQNIVPESDEAITSQFINVGMSYRLGKDVAPLFGKNIKAILGMDLNPLGITDYNSLFHCIHPGGRGIIDSMAQNLGINEENLVATRHVLSEYGNMGSPSVIFVLNEMRNRSKVEKKATTGDGKEYGVLIGMGPGLTVESVVLRSMPIA